MVFLLVSSAAYTGFSDCNLYCVVVVAVVVVVLLVLMVGMLVGQVGAAKVKQKRRGEGEV